MKDKDVFLRELLARLNIKEGLAPDNNDYILTEKEDRGRRTILGAMKVTVERLLSENFCDKYSSPLMKDLFSNFGEDKKDRKQVYRDMECLN